MKKAIFLVLYLFFFYRYKTEFQGTGSRRTSHGMACMIKPPSHRCSRSHTTIAGSRCDLVRKDMAGH